MLTVSALQRGMTLNCIWWAFHPRALRSLKSNFHCHSAWNIGLIVYSKIECSLKCCVKRLKRWNKLTEKWFAKLLLFSPLIIWIPCQKGLNYADCIPLAEGQVPPPPPRRDLLAMTLNCIWWWGSSPGYLGNVKYPFIAITLRFNLTWNGSTC